LELIQRELKFACAPYGQFVARQRNHITARSIHRPENVIVDPPVTSSTDPLSTSKKKCRSLHGTSVIDRRHQRTSVPD